MDGCVAVDVAVAVAEAEINPFTINPSIGVNLESIWGRSGVDLGFIWGRFGVDLGSIWGRSGVNVESIWGRSGVDLGLIWDQFEGIFDQRSKKNEKIGEIQNLRKFEN